MNEAEKHFLQTYLEEGCIKIQPKYFTFQLFARWDEPDFKDNWIAWRAIWPIMLTKPQLEVKAQEWWDDYKLRVKQKGPRKGFSLEALGAKLKKLECKHIGFDTWCSNIYCHYTFPQKGWHARDYKMSFLKFVEEKYDLGSRHYQLNNADILSAWEGPYTSTDRYGRDVVIISHIHKDVHRDPIQRIGETIDEWRRRNTGKRPDAK